MLTDQVHSSWRTKHPLLIVAQFTNSARAIEPRWSYSEFVSA